MEDMNPHTQESQRIPSRINLKRSTRRHMTIKKQVRLHHLSAHNSAMAPHLTQSKIPYHICEARHNPSTPVTSPLCLHLPVLLLTLSPTTLNSSLFFNPVHNSNSITNEGVLESPTIIAIYLFLLVVQLFFSASRIVTLLLGAYTSRIVMSSWRINPFIIIQCPSYP